MKSPSLTVKLPSATLPLMTAAEIRRFRACRIEIITALVKGKVIFTGRISEEQVAQVDNVALLARLMC